MTWRDRVCMLVGHRRDHRFRGYWCRTCHRYWPTWMEPPQ